MSRVSVALASLLAAQAATAGPIAQEFRGGYDGIAWGTTLTAVVGALPGGDHYFSSEPGTRMYSVRNDAPLFGIPREGMKVQYCFSAAGGVDNISIRLAYEEREALLGTLITLFGPYNRVMEKDSAISYVWPWDHEISISVRASREPTNGILEFWIHHHDPDPHDRAPSRN